MAHLKMVGAICLCVLLLVPATLLASFVQRMSGFAYDADTWMPWPVSEIISHWFPAASMGLIGGFLALLFSNLALRNVDYQVVAYVVSTVVIIIQGLIWALSLMSTPTKWPIDSSFQTVGVIVGLFLACRQTKDATS